MIGFSAISSASLRGKKFALEIERQLHQSQHYGHFHQRADDRHKRRPRMNAEQQASCHFTVPSVPLALDKVLAYDLSSYQALFVTSFRRSRLVMKYVPPERSGSTATLH